MNKRCYVANRGENLYRIAKSARPLGFELMTAYHPVDEYSKTLKAMNKAIPFAISEADINNPMATYVNADYHMQAIEKLDCHFVHPGVGLLSEDANFAKMVEDSGRCWVGPSSEIITITGDKVKAKEVIAANNIPTAPLVLLDGQTKPKEALKRLESLTWPIILKPRFGGGGQGMQKVDKPTDLPEALALATHAAQTYFGNSALLAEPWLDDVRHIEVQVVAGSSDKYLHFFSRDCSVQRRQQKIIEIAPAPGLNADTAKRIHQASLDCIKALKYKNVGTVEFLLLPNDEFYFMEMNPRLQVEHGITEMITGVDLVELQFKIAMGEPLNIKQSQIKLNGAAYECRLYAEDPLCDFMPQTGAVYDCKWPCENFRVDTALADGDTVSMHFDPMIAKIMAHGESDADALNNIKQAMAETSIKGVGNNGPWLSAILSQLNAEKLNTNWLLQNNNRQDINHELIAWVAAYVVIDEMPDRNNINSPWFNDGFQLSSKPKWSVDFNCPGEKKLKLTVLPDGNISYIIAHIDDLEYRLKLSNISFISKGFERQISFDWVCVDNKNLPTANIINNNISARLHDNVLYLMGPESWLWLEKPSLTSSKQDAGLHSLLAPMPGKILSVDVIAGQTVSTGEPLMILEAMKMQHTVLSPQDGIIDEIFYQTGDQVDEGLLLLKFE